MTNKIYIGIIVVLLGVAGYGFFRSTPVAPSGSVTGPEVFSDTFTVNGVPHFYAKTSVRSATTTVCAVKTPTATSTVIFAGNHFKRASDDGVAVFDVGIGTTAFATTSAGLMASNASLATGPVQGSFLFGTTTYITVAPNSFLIWKFSTSSLSANFSVTGKCEAEFLVL